MPYYLVTVVQPYSENLAIFSFNVLITFLPKHFKNFISDSFLKQFSNKGRLKDIVKTIPIRIILDEEFGLHSAACRAKMLLSNQ